MRKDNSSQTSLSECIFFGAGGSVVLSLVMYFLSLSALRVVIPFFLVMSDFGNFSIAYLSNRAYHPLSGFLLVYAVIGAVIGFSFHLTDRKEGFLQAKKDALISLGIILGVNLLLIIWNLS